MSSLNRLVLRILKRMMLLAIFSFAFFHEYALAEPGIRITYPPNNTIVHPGEEISTTVESVDGFDLEVGMIFLPSEKGFVIKSKIKGPEPDNPSFTTLPMTYTFTIPLEAIGSERIEVYGRSKSGEEAVDNITLIVEQTGILESLIVHPAKVIVLHLDWSGNLDKTWGDFGAIGADGLYSDGIKRSLKEQGVVFASSDPSVISIDGDGRYKIHKVGEAKIMISYGGITEEIPVVLQQPRGIRPSETIPPATQISIEPQPNSAGWNNSDITITLSAADNEGGSGIREISYQFPRFTGKPVYVKNTQAIIAFNEEGINLFRYGASDKEGNNTGQQSIEIHLDKTPPAITLTTPENDTEYLLNSQVVASWSATDALSGIKSATGSVPSGSALDTTTAGAKSFSVVAIDNADNTTETKHTYYLRYDYSGALPPINPDGSSVFKLGRVVPVKFQLKDASGNYISTATAKIYLSKISDNVAGTEIEAESSGEANTGNLFRYDTADNQYIFNLGTKNLSKGTWQVKITLDDGSSKYVNISLK